MSHPGPNGGNLPSHTNSGASNSRQQDTGLHGTSQDPGPSCNPQHHVSARPLLYIHAPPPPPPSFLHYQWPMPFSYNPFAGFPGMGYGMVMPTFPPYMEAPTYILPQPHIQPVDYRLLLQPQVHVPSTSIQNPNQTHRIRLPHTVPVRQTVNIEVQTEPPQPTQTSVGHYGQRSPVVGSDSGHGTTSSSPSSSTSFEKKGSEAENYTLPHSDVKDIQVNRTCTSDAVFNIIEPTEMETAQSSIRATLETQRSCNDIVDKENVSICKEDHCNMGSVSSPDSEGPVCSSSQQEDEVAKERSVSSSNILISWGSGTPQATLMNLPDKVLPQNDQQLLSSETELEHEKLVGQSPNETNNDQLVADNININDAAENILSSKNSENFFKILKLPFTLHEIFFDSRSDCEPVEMESVRHSFPYKEELLYSVNESQFPDKTQESEMNPHEDTTELLPYRFSLNSSQMRRKMNESVWSVESLVPFIPPKEWLLHNGMFEPEVTVEEDEHCRHSNHNDRMVVKARKERRQAIGLSSSGSVPVSDSWLIFSTPAEKQSTPQKPAMESEMDSFEMRVPQQGHTITLSGNNPLESPTYQQSKISVSTPPEEDVDENGSSEPEANLSPNQDLLIVSEQREESPGSPEQEDTLLLNSADGEKISPTGQVIVQNDVDTGTEDGTCGTEDGACGSKEVSQLPIEQLCVPVADPKITEVSPSKRHLVDCGIQCNKLQECTCGELKGCIGPNRKYHFKNPGMKKANHGNAEGLMMNGHVQKNLKRHGQWRNKGSESPSIEKHSSQQEAYNGYGGRLGKSKGGNGRNPRC